MTLLSHAAANLTPFQYHWGPFVTGLIVSEFPYLIVCALLYFVCWYFVPGLNTSAYSAGSVFFAIVSSHALLKPYIEWFANVHDHR
jgi:ABC-type multidrug transport system permease subunit